MPLPCESHYDVLLVATIVAVDFLFFRNRFWQRLMVNIGIVLVFAAFYFRFLNRPWEPGLICPRPQREIPPS
jgi:hypothetical protein